MPCNDVAAFLLNRDVGSRAIEGFPSLLVYCWAHTGQLLQISIIVMAGPTRLGSGGTRGLSGKWPAASRVRSQQG